MKLFILHAALLCAVVYGASVPEATTTDNKSKEKDDFVLPTGIPTCSQNDEKLNECLRDVFQQMLPKLHQGNKELNIPPIDPFVLKNTKYEYSNGILAGHINIKDTKVYGLSRTQIKDVRFNITDEGTQLYVESFTPRAFIEGSYKADMKLNDVKLNPKGYFNVSMSDVSFTQEMEGKFETIDGKRHLRLVKYDISPEVGDMKIYASGIFPDPTLNAIVLDFINQYWREIYKVIIPETRVYWEPLALNAMNEFMLHVPFDKLITKN